MRRLIYCLHVRCLLVQPKLTTLTKNIGAHVAFVRLQSGVDVLVIFEVLLQAKLFVAKLALKVFFVMLFEVSFK